jgi:hypothetical protein
MGDASDAYETYVNELDEENVDSRLSIEEWAEENNVVWNPAFEMWQAIHHDGLSCWSLEAQSDFGAMIEAAILHKEGKIEWAGFGSATKGTLSLVAKVPGIAHLYIFECEDIEGEV